MSESKFCLKTNCGWKIFFVKQISQNELCVMIYFYACYNVTMFQEAEEIMCVFDHNNDGFISFSEFRCMMGANPILLS